MKKSYFLTLSLAVSGILTVAATVLSNTEKFASFNAKAGDSEVSYTLGSEQAPTDATSYTDVTKTFDVNAGSDVEFSFTDVKASTGNLCSLDEGGTIFKTDASHGLSSITAKFDGALNVVVGKDGLEDKNLCYVYPLTSEVATVVSGNYFKIVALEETTITSLSLNYGCVVESTDTAHESFKLNGVTTTLESWNNSYPGVHASVVYTKSGSSTIKDIVFETKTDTEITIPGTIDTTAYNKTYFRGAGKASITVTANDGLNTKNVTFEDGSDVTLISTEGKSTGLKAHSTIQVDGNLTVNKFAYGVYFADNVSGGRYLNVGSTGHCVFDTIFTSCLQDSKNTYITEIGINVNGQLDFVNCKVRAIQLQHKTTININEGGELTTSGGDSSSNYMVYLDANGSKINVNKGGQMTVKANTRGILLDGVGNSANEINIAEGGKLDVETSKHCIMIHKSGADATDYKFNISGIVNLTTLEEGHGIMLINTAGSRLEIREYGNAVLNINSAGYGMYAGVTVKRFYIFVKENSSLNIVSNGPCLSGIHYLMVQDGETSAASVKNNASLSLTTNSGAANGEAIQFQNGDKNNTADNAYMLINTTKDVIIKRSSATQSKQAVRTGGSNGTPYFTWEFRSVVTFENWTNCFYEEAYRYRYQNYKYNNDNPTIKRVNCGSTLSAGTSKTNAPSNLVTKTL